MSVDGNLWRTALLMLVLFCTSLSAKDDNSDLPLNTILDENGNPIALADLKQPAMEYTNQELKPIKSQSVKNKPKKKKRFKDLSRKEMLKSRANVANDPSCHWLNQRMNQLERKLMNNMSGMDMKYGYHKKELELRKKEWVCLKCGVEGPAVHDYAKCQFKR